MRTVFADSFYYLALINRNDAAHLRAAELASRLRPRVITTAWVITEMADAMCDAHQRGRFLALLHDLEVDPEVVIVAPSKELYVAGLDLFSRRPDKDWSLTDCISFEVMQRYGLSDALTADRHFQQAGFNALLV